MQTTAQELVNYLHDAQRNGVDLSKVWLHLQIPNEIGFVCDKYNFIEDFPVIPCEESK